MKLRKIFRSVEGTVEWIYSLKEVTSKKKHITLVIEFNLKTILIRQTK